MIQFLFAFNSYGLLFLRLALGAILLVHGAPKFLRLKATAAAFAGMGFRPGGFWAVVAGAVEVLGGLMIIGGFLTQIAAFIVALQFLVIIFKVKRKNGFKDGYEFDLLILAGALLLLTSGGGAYSIDEFLDLILY